MSFLFLFPAFLTSPNGFYVKLTKNSIKCKLKIMSELDEVKEILNTLRVAMSLSFGMLVIVVSGIIKRFDDANIDSIFWLGTLFSLFLLAVIFLLINKISQRTKEIKEL